MTSLIPIFVQANAHHGASIERFGDYVVRQLGIPVDHPSANLLSRSAEDYLRGDKTQADHSRDKVLTLLCNSSHNTEDMVRMGENLVAELDACIVTYFGFHWKHSGQVVDQVLHGPRPRMTFREAVKMATRAQRYKRVMVHLGPKQQMSVLVEEMRALKAKEDDSRNIPQQGEVLVPAESSLRSPVLMMLGGGMGAGKSTAVKEVLKRSFWSMSAQDAVVVEADAFKEKDVIYQELSQIEQGDISQVAALVHESSTTAASSMLVTALNEGRDVIFDGTMSWEPFVEQTVAMVRDVHRNRYRLGPGYKQLPDGSYIENYWQLVGPHDAEKAAAGEGAPRPSRLPYRIEFVGVMCDAHLAVSRGLRRAILTRRGVPISSQLRSHRLFAAAVERYSLLVDYTSIYCTDAIGDPPEMIALKEGTGKLLVDVDAFEGLKKIAKLNVGADSALELYHKGNSLDEYEPGRVWQTTVVPPERAACQAALRLAILQKDAPSSR